MKVKFRMTTAPASSFQLKTLKEVLKKHSQLNQLLYFPQLILGWGYYSAVRSALDQRFSTQTASRPVFFSNFFPRPTTEEPLKSATTRRLRNAALDL